MATSASASHYRQRRRSTSSRKQAQPVVGALHNVLWDAGEVETGRRAMCTACRRSSGCRPPHSDRDVRPPLPDRVGRNLTPFPVMGAVVMWVAGVRRFARQRRPQAGSLQPDPVSYPVSLLKIIKVCGALGACVCGWLLRPPRSRMNRHYPVDRKHLPCKFCTRLNKHASRGSLQGPKGAPRPSRKPEDAPLCSARSAHGWSVAQS